MNREDISDTDEENKLNAFVTALLPAAHWGPGVGGGSHALHTRAALLPHIHTPGCHIQDGHAKHALMSLEFSCSVVSNSETPWTVTPPGSSIQGIYFPGRNTGVGCHFLLQSA